MSEKLQTLWTKAAFAAQHPVALKRKLKAAAVRPFVTQTYDPISFLDRDWDTLVVLDACRYDLIAELTRSKPRSKQ